ncbi:MAG: hypothetical protein QMC77_04400 [Methanocellales archaeon]|nr:hypothetical protein [Methanocellales archaeon]
MTRQTSKGKCSFCNAVLSKAKMTKHLKSCEKRKAALGSSLAMSSARKTKIFHIIVEGRYLPKYWMHLDAPTTATLEDLDEFLRDTWVECCGHMSAFTIQGARYTTGLGIDAMWINFFGLDAERDMDVALGKVLVLGTKFSYEYDFGTTTELALKVVAEREGGIKGESIQLLARNEPPLIPCDVCGKIATQVCAQCIWDNEGWFCDKCARKHACGEDMLMPVVNSPRVGMCGYTG